MKKEIKLDDKELKKAAIKAYAEENTHKLKGGIAKLKASKLLMQHEKGFSLTLELENVGKVKLKFSEESKGAFKEMVNAEIHRFEDLMTKVAEATEKKLEELN